MLRIAFASALCVLATVARLAAAEGTPPASAAIERLNAAMLDVMKNAEKLGLEGRREKLEPVLDATYDFPAMAQRSLGPAFAKLDDAQRARFVLAFRGMTLRTYASRFTGWSGESFEVKGQEDSVAGTVIVRSVVHAKNEDVSLDYRLRDTPTGWRVIDVYLRGTVSELALRRAEYSAVLEREGFEALLSALERKLAEGSGGAGSPGSDAPGAIAPSSDSRDK
jgi:phospholipid transport system substrate-binding protein